MNPLIILADIGTEWPEVFGPYTNLGDAETYADELISNEHVRAVKIQVLIRGDEIES